MIWTRISHVIINITYDAHSCGAKDNTALKEQAAGRPDKCCADVETHSRHLPSAVRSSTTLSYLHKKVTVDTAPGGIKPLCVGVDRIP